MKNDQPLLTLFRVTKEVHRQSFFSYEGIGVHHGQPRLLKILKENEGWTLSELSLKMRSEMATVSKMVKRMEHAGFLLRRRDEKDSRIIRVFLSDSGKKAAADVDKVHEEMNSLLCRSLTGEEREALQFLLDKVLRDLLNEENK